MFTLVRPVLYVLSTACTDALLARQLHIEWECGRSSYRRCCVYVWIVGRVWQVMVSVAVMKFAA